MFIWQKFVRLSFGCTKWELKFVFNQQPDNDLNLVNPFDNQTGIE